MTSLEKSSSNKEIMLRFFGIFVVVRPVSRVGDNLVGTETEGRWLFVANEVILCTLVYLLCCCICSLLLISFVLARWDAVETDSAMALLATLALLFIGPLWYSEGLDEDSSGSLLLACGKGVILGSSGSAVLVWNPVILGSRFLVGGGGARRCCAKGVDENSWGSMDGLLLLETGAGMDIAGGGINARTDFC
jgi:hypothetical protein